MTENTNILQQLTQIAHENDVLLTNFAPNIAKLRERRNIPLTICPCSPNDKDRCCISAKCLREINENGACHCNCFKKKNMISSSDDV